MCTLKHKTKPYLILFKLFFQVIITKEYLHLEPIGIVLVFFFFAIIVIQFTAMLFHRLGTLSHILVRLRRYI